MRTSRSLLVALALSSAAATSPGQSARASELWRRDGGYAGLASVGRDVVTADLERKTVVGLSREGVPYTIADLPSSLDRFTAVEDDGEWLLVGSSHFGEELTVWHLTVDENSARLVERSRSTLTVPRLESRGALNVVAPYVAEDGVLLAMGFTGRPGLSLVTLAGDPVETHTTPSVLDLVIAPSRGRAPELLACSLSRLVRVRVDPTRTLTEEFYPWAIESVSANEIVGFGRDPDRRATAARMDLTGRLLWTTTDLPTSYSRTTSVAANAEAGLVAAGGIGTESFVVLSLESGSRMVAAVGASWPTHREVAWFLDGEEPAALCVLHPMDGLTAIEIRVDASAHDDG